MKRAKDMYKSARSEINNMKLEVAENTGGHKMCVLRWSFLDKKQLPKAFNADALVSLNSIFEKFLLTQTKSSRQYIVKS